MASMASPFHHLAFEAGMSPFFGLHPFAGGILPAAAAVHPAAFAAQTALFAGLSRLPAFLGHPAEVAGAGGPSGADQMRMSSTRSPRGLLELLIHLKKNKEEKKRFFP
jgi:hypothetical protein